MYRRGDWDDIAVILDPHTFIRLDRRWPEQFALHQQVAEKVDIHALAEAISNGEQVMGESEYKTKGLYADIAKAREKLTDTAGTRLRPTHFFTTSDIYSYATRQVDATTARPILTPKWAPGLPLSGRADDGRQGDGARPKWSRFTGTVLHGNVLWFVDDNIGTKGTTNQGKYVMVEASAS